MKIKEAVNRIESTSKSIFAWEHEGYIHISWNTFTILVVPYEAKTMLDCHFVNPNLELPADVKAQIGRIIGKFLRTPVKERFTEKKYVLSAMRCAEGPIPIKQYVNAIKTSTNNVEFHFGFANEKADAMEFTQKELDDLSDFFPKVAIDAMKEEVKGNG